MTKVEEFKKICFKKPIKMDDKIVLEITNWINEDLAYMYIDKIDDYSMLVVVETLSADKAARPDYCLNSKLFVNADSIKVNTAINFSVEFILESILIAIVRMIEYVSHDPVEFVPVHSYIDAWKEEQISDVLVVEYIASMLRKFASDVLSDNEYRSYVFHILNDERNNRFDIDIFSKVKYFSIGEQHCNMPIDYNSIGIHMTLDPHARFIMHELKDGKVVEISTTSSGKAKKYFIRDSIHQYIATDLTANEDFWLEVSAEKFNSFMGDKVELDISDDEISKIPNMEHYLDMLNGGKPPVNYQMLLSFIQQTMPDTGVMEYTRYAVYRKDYNFSQLDATAAYLDYAYRYARNPNVDKFLKGHGYSVDIRDTEAGGNRSYLVSRV